MWGLDKTVQKAGAAGGGPAPKCFGGLPLAKNTNASKGFGVWRHIPGVETALIASVERPRPRPGMRDGNS